MCACKGVPLSYVTCDIFIRSLDLQNNEIFMVVVVFNIHFVVCCTRAAQVHLQTWAYNSDLARAESSLTVSLSFLCAYAIMKAVFNLLAIAVVLFAIRGYDAVRFHKSGLVMHDSRICLNLLCD